MLGANAAIPQGLNVIPPVVRFLHKEGTEPQRRLAASARVCMRASVMWSLEGPSKQG